MLSVFATQPEIPDSFVHIFSFADAWPREYGEYDLGRDSVANCAVTASSGPELRRCAIPWRSMIGIAW